MSYRENIRRAILEYHTDKPDAGQREIARAIGCSANTVAATIKNPDRKQSGVKWAGSTRQKLEALFAENPDRTDKQFAELAGCAVAYARQIVEVLRLKAIAKETEGEQDYVPSIAQAVEKQLGLYLGRALEWKAAMEAGDFCRFLIWSNIIDLCEKRGVRGLRGKLDAVIEAVGHALQNANPPPVIREFRSLDERLARIESLLLRFEREQEQEPPINIDARPVQGPMLLRAGRDWRGQ